MSRTASRPPLPAFKAMLNPLNQPGADQAASRALLVVAGALGFQILSSLASRAFGGRKVTRAAAPPHVVSRSGGSDGGTCAAGPFPIHISGASK